MHWLDAVTIGVAPRWTVRRMAARARGEILARHYEAASTGRRTQGWTRHISDPNASAATGLRLRGDARDLVRNNPYAEAASATIADHVVGWGIVAKPAPGAPRRKQAAERWKRWAETTACDADGRLDFAGLQKLVMRTVVEAGECLVRRRIRLPSDGLPIPIQLQVLEPDFLDTMKDGTVTESGGRIIQGVEFDVLGRRAKYWLLKEHPGSTFLGGGIGTTGDQSVPISATEILHVFRPWRPGQVRGVTWFAPVMLRMKDFDEYEDAALLKQKISACLAVITTDADGSATPLGGTNPEQPLQDMLEPGMILNAPPGRLVTVVDPPSVSEHAAYAQTVLQAIAAGLGVTYEDITGNYSNMPFSAARMSRLRHQARIDDWRWRMLIPQFCDPVWRWAMQAAAIVDTDIEPVAAEWTCPPMPFVDPATEATAYRDLVRNGAMTWDEMVRERGYDPDEQQAEIAARNKQWDAAGITLDCDPRKTSQQGQPSAAMAPAATASPLVAEPTSNGNGRGVLT